MVNSVLDQTFKFHKKVLDACQITLEMKLSRKKFEN